MEGGGRRILGSACPAHSARLFERSREQGGLEGKSGVPPEGLALRSKFLSFRGRAIRCKSSPCRMAEALKGLRAAIRTGQPFEGLVDAAGFPLLSLTRGHFFSDTMLYLVHDWRHCKGNHFNNIRNRIS